MQLRYGNVLGCLNLIVHAVVQSKPPIAESHYCVVWGSWKQRSAVQSMKLLRSHNYTNVWEYLKKFPHFVCFLDCSEWKLFVPQDGRDLVSFPDIHNVMQWVSWSTNCTNRQAIASGYWVQFVSVVSEISYPKLTPLTNSTKPLPIHVPVSQKYTHPPFSWQVVAKGHLLLESTPTLLARTGKHLNIHSGCLSRGWPGADAGFVKGRG